MRQVHIEYPGADLDFAHAASLAQSLADDDRKVIEPVLMAWCDRHASRMSPVIEGADLRNRWRDYGESHGGRLEIDVGDDYAFVYADSSAFDPYEASPYSNLSDGRGNEYLCQINLLRDPHQPTPDACVALDEWTSKLT
jgi:hypothetical protein